MAKKIDSTKPASKKSAPVAKSKAKTQEAASAELQVPRAPRAVKELQPPRGFRDILPVDEGYWDYFSDTVRMMARSFGYRLISTPLVESRDLFVRTVGEYTDIAEKEMFTFEDAGGDRMCLRPEATASIARAYINHGMFNLPQPVKLYYMGTMFRHERPQAGRYRQFNQFGFEVLGNAHPAIDAEGIALAHLFYKELGVKTEVRINSLGTAQSRAAYVKELSAHFKKRKDVVTDESLKMRIAKNPLRVLDSKGAEAAMLREGAPQIIDFLDDESRDHFFRVLEYLDELEIKYVLDPYLVRGLDYYTKTVFEILPHPSLYENKAQAGGGDDAAAQLPAQSALCAGGRYDTLIEQLGGRPTPAFGFAGGVERGIAFLRAIGRDIPAYQPLFYFAQLGESARRKGMALFMELRKEFPIVASFDKDSLRNQLEIANRYKVRYTLILGQKEAQDGTIMLRDMEAGVQEVIDINKIAPELRKKMAALTAAA